MTCPNTLQVLYVGTVTNPVTHSDVVAVNNASIYETDSPAALEIGSHNKILPITIASAKPTAINFAADKLFFFFFITLITTMGTDIEYVGPPFPFGFPFGFLFYYSFEHLQTIKNTSAGYIILSYSGTDSAAFSSGLKR